MELIVLLLLLLAAVWLQGVLYRTYAFRRLDYSCSLDRREAVEGDRIHLQEVVSNRKLLPLPWLKSEITTSKWLEFSELQSVVTGDTHFISSFFLVRSFQRVTRTWEGRCLKRGVFTIQKTVLVASDLLGGASFSSTAPAGSQVVVFPKALDLEENFISVSRNMGETCVRRNLLPDPFFIAGVREYQQGDPMNHIHWPATAREGRLMVYQNDSSSSQSRAVILNMQTREYANSGAVDADLLENAIRTCAALFEQTAGENIPLRFLANTPDAVATEEAWGESCLHSLLDLLARLPLKSGEHFPFYLNALHDSLTATDIILVTCYLDDAIMRFAHDKMDAGVPVRLYLLDPNPLPMEAGDLDIFMVRAPSAQKGGEAS